MVVRVDYLLRMQVGLNYPEMSYRCLSDAFERVVFVVYTKL